MLYNVVEEGKTHPLEVQLVEKRMELNLLKDEPLKANNSLGEA